MANYGWGKNGSIILYAMGGGEDASSSEDNGRGDSGDEIARDIRRKEDDREDTSIEELNAPIDLKRYDL